MTLPCRCKEVQQEGDSDRYVLYIFQQTTHMKCMHAYALHVFRYIRHDEFKIKGYYKS
jgi:hypothetical protein